MFTFRHEKFKSYGLGRLPPRFQERKKKKILEVRKPVSERRADDAVSMKPKM